MILEFPGFRLYDISLSITAILLTGAAIVIAARILEHREKRTRQDGVRPGGAGSSEKETDYDRNRTPDRP